MNKILILVVMISGTVLSQPMRSGDEREGPNRGRPEFIYTEALNLASADSVLARIDVHYRINTDFFVSVKNTDPAVRGELMRRGDILIELEDSTGVSRAREIDHVEVGAETSGDQPKPKDWYQGMASFNVPPGLYKVILEIDDLESDRKFIDRNTTVRARKLLPISLETSTPMLVQWSDSILETKTLIPENFGGNMQFGNRSAVFVELVSSAPSETPLGIKYSLATVSNQDKSPHVIVKDSTAEVRIIQGVVIAPKKEENVATYSIGQSPSSRVTGLLVPFHTEKLPLRAFELGLSISQGAQRTHVEKRFHMVWPDMPFSLRDVEFALDALRYITTEQQLDSLKRGSFEIQRDNLEAFWKAKDPTPETAYNELMVQYYQRVDEAMKKFGTLREPNGFKSDRGRVYVLYGPPTSVDRTLSVATGFQEVWVYENLKKKFIFLDESKTGNYVLVSTFNL